MDGNEICPTNFDLKSVMPNFSKIPQDVLGIWGEAHLNLHINFFNFCPLHTYRSRDSSVGITTGCTVGVGFPAGERNFHFLHSVKTCSRTHPASIQCVRVPFPVRVKRLGRGTDHSIPSSLEVKDDRVVHPFLHISASRGA